MLLNLPLKIIERKMTRIKIQKFINDDINPSLEMHGGYVIIEDYEEDLFKSGLIFNNPNMTKSCGCGKSVNY